MDDDLANATVFLNMNAPTHEPLRLQAAPSAIFELVHVGFRMTPKVRLHKRSEWIEGLIARQGDVAATLLSFWDDDYHVGMELAFIAGVYGYIRDTDVQRFLEALPELIAQLHHRGLNHRDTLKDTEDENKVDIESDHQLVDAIYERVARLMEPEFLNLYIELWQRVWAEMQPLWEKEGLMLAQQEAERINNALANNQDIFDIIPREHMGQFEHHSNHIKKYRHNGYVIINPLYFISVGGHSIFVEDSMFIGYGIHIERAHEELLHTSQHLAQQIKALADPTRLMILALISEFEHRITVGDLAKRFGVSQPTISGHLRILREADLVVVKREGNRAYYSTDATKIDQLMLGIESLIVPAKDMSIKHTEPKALGRPIPS